MSREQEANQHHHSNSLNQQLEEHSRILAALLHNQSNQRAQFTGYQPIVAASSPSAESVVRISGYTSRNKRSPCDTLCVCECHIKRTFQSLTLLDAALGSLFAGYSGYPLVTFRQCTEPECLAQSSSNFRVSVDYLFPSWFITRALTFYLEKLCLSKISVSLTVRRIMSSAAEIFRMVHFGDVKAIKQMFIAGLACPNDCMPDGGSALHVSNISEYRSNGVLFCALQ